MKKYRLVYLPEAERKKCIFTNINLKKLSAPVTIAREKPIEEEPNFHIKKRSEVVEYEKEEYIKLKNKEACPLVIEDIDGLTFLGKLQDVGSNSSSYFTFIREEDVIYITPIQKWYRFTQKITHVEDVDAEEVSKKIKEINKFEEEYESDKEEIDFEDNFEDDDGEDLKFSVIKEKKLSRTGKKLKSLVQSLEKDDYSGESDIIEDEPDFKEESNSESHVELLTAERIRKCFITPKLSVKELIRKLKTSFELNDEEKQILKNFINEFCIFETDKITGEKLLKLKEAK